ncbi:Uncharacterized protein TPAR_05403 [Tolypocladium paradoxum]|uniref:Uncharacterized protein n=1 Tax=Tolypocladium paradoxum TaxID=94208 RepID=A0A2S4KW30_9HYPO|nr:Uncharacterized protein TPAR_05403 [Tolypocladium paradoxum]
MRPWHLLAACGLAPASCWVFPAGLEEGVYVVSLPDASSRNDSSEAVVVRRQEFDGGQDTLPDAPPEDDYPGHDAGPYDEFRAPKNLPLRNLKKHRDRVPVPVSVHGCVFNTPRLMPDEHERARRSLARYCARYLVPAFTAHVSVSSNGQAGSFVCNLGPRAQVCSGREYDWVQRNWLDARCGQLRPGQAEARKWMKWYGRAYPGMIICPDEIETRRIMWHGSPTDSQPGQSDDESASLGAAV